jgi:3-oxoacyl-[acyl-carrier protein] reductase
MSLASKIALVIGGSGGIGRATAELFAEAGATTIITYRSGREAAEALVAGLPGSGHLALPASVEDTASLKALAEEVRSRFGRLDILVNTAGFTKLIPHGDLEALDDELIDRLFQVNWRGQFAAIRTFRPLLEAGWETTGEDTLIVNVSSLAALNGLGSNVAYCAVKAGIDTMTKSLARAFAPKIRVMSVSPGMVDTQFVPGRDPAVMAKAAQTIPLKRAASPLDVGKAILACATLLPYSTGSIVLVDGGRLL